MSGKGTSIREELDPLFNPRSVAVIGATNQWNKWGFSTFVSVLDGFRGKVYPVNLQERQVLGRLAYRRVTDIPPEEPVDLAVFVIPAQSIPEVMEECVKKGVRAGVIISAGFAETGERGKRLQEEVLEIARKGPIRFIGPNCMGFYSGSSALKAFMFPLSLREGPLAFVSQGGNVGAAVVQTAYARGMGFHRYVSCGCAADIQIEDYIEYFGHDEEVKVILAYIEGLNDGQRFVEKVSEVTKRKPVIALKPGKTEAATKAITSHSGALSGSSELYDSAFRKAGVIRVETAEALLDVAAAFLTQPLPKGRRVAIITPGGSYGVMSADACASLGLEVVRLSEETIAELDSFFPPRWSHGNPVDPAGDRNFIAYMKAPELLLRLPEIDAMIFMGFDSFARFASSATLFATMSEESAQTFRGLLRSVSQSVLGAAAGADPGSGNPWVGEAIKKVVDIFFSLFGTSERADVEAFGERLVSLIAKGKVPADIGEKFHKALSTFMDEDPQGIGDPFAEVFEPLMEGLLLEWIDSYGKPIITTTFMGAASPMTEMGYYAYPSAEQAAYVLAKLVEYRERMEREGLAS
jgi:acyl-CoA synthetase (NDP forming)